MITGEELAAYSAGEADQALVARIEAALPHDEALQARLAVLHKVDHLLANLPPVDLPAAAARRITASAAIAARDHLDQRSPNTVVDLSSRRRLAPRMTGWAAAAAVVVAVVAVGSSWMSTRDGQDAATGTSATMGDAAQDVAGENGADLGSDDDNPVMATEQGAAAAEPGELSFAPSGGGEYSEPVVIDDGRVLASASDVDVADQLARAARNPVLPTTPAAPRAESGGVGDATFEASEEASETTAGMVSPDIVGDGVVSSREHDLALTCIGEVDRPVVVAELATVSPDVRVVIYVVAGQPTRVVTVALDGCAVLADQPA